MQGLHQDTLDSSARAVDTHNALWLLERLSGLFRRPFDRDLARQQLTRSLSPATLTDAIGLLGLHVQDYPWPSQNEAQALPLPAVLFLQQQDAPDQESALLPAIMVQSDGQQAALLRPDSTAPQVVPIASLREHSEPLMLVITRDEPAAEEPSGTPDAEAPPRPFGLSWFLPEILRHRALWRDVLLASLFIQLIGLSTPLFTQVIIDKVIAHHSLSTLWVLSAAMVVFMLFGSAMSWLRQYLVVHTGSRIDAVLGEKVMRHLLRLPLAYFEHRPTGTLVARLQGVETLREFVSGAAIGLILDLPFLTFLLALMFSYSPMLTLIALAVMGLIASASLVMVPLFRQRLDRQFLLGARNQAFLTEHLSGMATVKSLQMEPELERRWGEQLAQYLSAGVATRQAANTYQVSASTLEQTMSLGILIVGAWHLMHNPGFTIGMLVAFQMFASRLSQPLMRLVGLWQEFQQANVAVKRLADIVDMPTEPITLGQRRTPRGPAGIEVRDLGFRYSERHPWLYRHLDLSIRPGQLVVLSGGSGCGKSTLARLLMSFRLPEEGRILIDGHDTRNLAANELRAAFGVVPQETVLFSGTIHDNLVMANPHANFDDVIAACRAAGIHETIEQLPQGYQTRIGEQGVGLSGGQRQRIAIARALLKQPRILIFDEAASNLDPDTAEQLAHTVNRLKGKATILYIAHQVPRTLAMDAHIDLECLTQPKQ